MQNAWWRRAWSEPLVRFVVLGAIVFVLDRALRPEEREPRRIEITPAFAAAMARREAGRLGHPPSDAELEAAIDAFVREEVLYREAIELGLDRGDLIVRRRLVQKMELWLDAQARDEAPSDEELEAWRRAHASELREPRRTSLELAFFADGSRERAEAALEEGVGAATGDPFAHGRTLTARTDAQLDSTLGEGAAEAIASMPIGTWSGPIQGRAGLFVIRPIERREAREPPLAEVRDRARSELELAARERARARRTEELALRWEVVRADRGAR
jgi:peptidyl-prolyl cis-trans isomerase C